MIVKQVYEILNSIVEEVTGQSGIVAEDLSNIVDIGSTLFSNTSTDNYVHALINRIGRTIFVNRLYESTAPNITRDAWEYGSVLQKVRCELPEAVSNPTWSLTKGQSYDPFVFTPPDIVVKYYNSKTTFQVQMSFTERQVKESFNNIEELNRFFSMIENAIRTTITLNRDNLTMRTINNLMAEKIKVNKGVFNLLSMYNTAFGTTLTAAKALSDTQFLKFATATIMNISERMKPASVLYNNSGVVTFSPKDKQKLVLLSEFSIALDIYLYSTTYHNELLKLGSFDTVPYWQGSGTTTPNFSTSSSINVKPVSGGNAITQSGILGVIFDRDACMICNENSRVTTQYNALGEFTTYFYKEDASYFNDLSENVAVFLVEDPAPAPTMVEN